MATPEPGAGLRVDPATLAAARAERHPHCFVCWDRHPFGLHVQYRAEGERSVAGVFGCGKSYEGYPGIVHGGIVSALLDGAAAACVLAMGLEAYTAELQVRFRAPLRTGDPATVRGTWTGRRGPLHLLEATVEQGGRVCASARAKFMEGHPQP